jgi:hypothetical protein
MSRPVNERDANDGEFELDNESGNINQLLS